MLLICLEQLWALPCICGGSAALSADGSNYQHELRHINGQQRFGGGVGNERQRETVGAGSLVLYMLHDVVNEKFWFSLCFHSALLQLSPKC